MAGCVAGAALDEGRARAATTGGEARDVARERVWGRGEYDVRGEAGEPVQCVPNAHTHMYTCTTHTHSANSTA